MKTAAFMEEMKEDMSGAAVAAAATIGIVRLGIPANITAITLLTGDCLFGVGELTALGLRLYSL